MPKIQRCGRSEIWTPTDLNRLIKSIDNPKHLLIIDLLRYTGERIGAIVQLRVEDVYSDPANRVPRDTILYRAISRKASSKGKRVSRGLPIHRSLANSLKTFDSPDRGYLFPSPTNRNTHITVASVDRWFRSGLDRAGLIGKGYSLHSFRRTVLTLLRRKGIDIKLIQKFSGHKSLDALEKYLDCDEGELTDVVELL